MNVNLKHRLCLLKRYNSAVFGPLCKLGETVLELLIPYLMINLINLMSQPINTADLSGVKRYRQIILTLLANPQFLQIIALSVITGILAISAQYFACKAATTITADIREKIWRHYLRLDTLSQIKLQQSDMNTRLINDCLAVQSGTNLGLRLLIRSPFIIIGSIIMCFIINPLAGGTLSISIILIAVLINYFLRKSLQAYYKMQQEVKSLYRQINEAKSGQSCIRAFIAEAKIIAKFQKNNNSQAAFNRIFSLLNAYIAPLSQALINIALLICLICLSLELKSGLVEAATIIAIYSYFSKSLIESIKFANLLVSLSKAIGSYRLIKRFLQLPTNNEENFSLSVPEHKEIGLEIKNLNFQYYQPPAILEKLNLPRLHSGNIYGIFGLQASGKSTLAKIIAGIFPDNNSLHIFYDRQLLNFPNAAAKTAFLAQNVAYVEQAPKLLSGTLRGNFRFNSQSDALLATADTEKAIWEALSQAEAATFVREKGGLDCSVSDKSGNFSGGQLARLALAIALYRKPEILILDDILQALDLSTALSVVKTLKRISQNCLIICLSQRLAPLINSDCIFILQDQQIKTYGSHHQLLANSNYYRELYNLEFPTINQGEQTNA